MRVTREHIEIYLAEVKEAVRAGRYQISMNSNRQDNLNFFADYLVDEEGAKEIILSLEVEDFSEVRKNKKPRFEHENLYVFGKEVRVVERFGDREKTVSLYIKFNQKEDKYVVIVSFHEQKFPLYYCFK